MVHDIEHDDLLKAVKEEDYDDLEDLCQQIRDFMIDKVSRTGGHLASNLGAVELTVALHRVYNSPEDKIIFDVGHQAYVHKIITGRADRFDTLRQYKGLSGFPKSYESEHDAYDTGHSSTSIGAAAGYAVARDLRGGHEQVVAVIGDGSMTGGLVYEALNNIGSRHLNVKIVLNDNEMSIAKNVGALSSHLTKLRTSDNYLKAKNAVKATLQTIPVLGNRISGNISNTKERIKFSILGDQAVFFEELGIKYIGPIDGSDLEMLTEAFTAANSIDGPTIVHVTTRKGMGYPFAEKYPRKFHGVGPFDKITGEVLAKSDAPSFSKVFGTKLNEMARDDDSIVAITAAMGTATGLGAFYKEHTDRFFDVGIAEQVAVVFAAGLAKGGMTPVCAIYSSFLQRAYDQIVEDVCLQGLHVIFAVDRAGLVGADGETHHGVFDLSYLGSVPGMEILCPADGNQLEEMLEYAVHKCSGPVAIRYPRGSSEGDHLRIKAFTGNNIQLTTGKDVTFIAVGAMLDPCLEAASLLRGRGIDVGVWNVGRVKPFVNSWKDLDTRLVVTAEDNVYSGGFGERFTAENYQEKYDIMCVSVPDEFVEQGTIAQLRAQCGMDAEHIAEGVMKRLEGKA